MNWIILQITDSSPSEEKIVLYIVGSVVFFFLLRLFLRNPGQFMIALMVRVALVIVSIIYLFWDEDVISDDLGFFGYVEDIVSPFLIWKYYVLKQYPFPKANSHNINEEHKSDNENGVKKNPPV